jgi:electron transfer flavoprotein beta subunit
MKIVACIKYSLDVSEIKVDEETEEIKLTGVPKSLGEIDENVLEAAATLKETYGGEVHGLSYGPLDAKDAFRDALAMGLEDVTLVKSAADEQIDPAVTALVLAEAIKKMGDVDLVICGELSDDGLTYQVPPRLAERLDLPQVSFVRQIEIEEGWVVAERELESGSQKVRAQLPALITVTQETNTPRRPTLMEAMQAKKKPVHLWDLQEDVGLTKDDLQNRSNLERMDTKGIVIHRKRVKMEGSDQREVANQLVDQLIEEGVLEGGA